MSSLRGARISGKRRRSALMISPVSSTESVVCVTYASLASGGTASASASSTVCTSTVASGASPVVPTTSS